MLYMFFLFILVVFVPSLTWKSAGNVAVHIASCYPVLYFVHVENKVCHFYKNTDCKCFVFLHCCHFYRKCLSHNTQLVFALWLTHVLLIMLHVRFIFGEL